MAQDLFIDLSHTSHAEARTGIQRVTLSLSAALEESGASVRKIVFDPYADNWRNLDRRERRHALVDPLVSPGRSRGARWTAAQKIRGRAKRAIRLGKSREFRLTDGAGLLLPELFSRRNYEAVSRISSSSRGPKVAVFHDLIAMHLPDQAPPGTVRRFPYYLKELHTLDGVLAISNWSRDDLLAWWDLIGLRNHPPVGRITPGISLSDRGRSEPPPASGTPVVFSLGSLEGRKNQAALVDAAELLWARGLNFELVVAGHLVRSTGAEIVERIRSAHSRGRPIRWLGHISDREVEELYRNCRFTVYPSLMEGFGLPVLESLCFGRPCLTGTGGALRETAGGGGCIALERLDPSVLAAAMERLLRDDQAYEALRLEAIARPLPTWDQAARDALEFIESVDCPNKAAQGKA